MTLTFIAFAAALVTADATLARVDRLIRAGKPQEAAAVYQKFEPWQPPGMRTDLWYARAMTGGSERAQNRADAVTAGREAMVAAVRATRNAEEPQNAWLNFTLSDGDNVQWVMGNFADGGEAPSFYAHPKRGLIPFTWGLPVPSLCQLSPRTLAEIRAVAKTSQK